MHDDENDARFVIRRVHSAGGNDPDLITEVFSVDNGNVAMSGELLVSDNVGIGLPVVVTHQTSTLTVEPVEKLDVNGNLVLTNPTKKQSSWIGDTIRLIKFRADRMPKWYGVPAMGDVGEIGYVYDNGGSCLLYTSPSPRD